MAVNKIYIQVDFQSQAADQAVTELNKNIANIGANSEKATQTATKGVSGFSLALEQATGAADALAEAIAAMGLAKLAADMVALGEETIRLNYAFSRMSGGADALKDIENRARDTLTPINAMKQGINDLVKSGYSLQDATRIFKALQDQAAATGSSQQELSSAVESLANTEARGLINTRSLIALRGIGIDVLHDLAKATHLSAVEFQTQGKYIPVDQMTKLIEYEINAKNAGAAMDLAQNTLSGHLNNLGVSFNNLATALDKAFTPALSKVIDAIAKAVDMATAATNAFAKWPEWIRELIVLLGALAAVLAAVGSALKVISILAGLKSLFTWIPTAIAGLTELLGLGTSIVTVFGEVGAAGAIGLGPVAAIVAAIVAGLFWIINNAAKAKQALGGGAAGAPPEVTIATNPEDVKRELEKSQSVLAEAQSRVLKASKEGIQALIPTFDEYFKKGKEIEVALAKERASATADSLERINEEIKDNEQALANYRLALWKDVTAEIAKREEDARKEVLKGLEENAKIQRQITIAAAEVMPDETFAGRGAVAQAREQAYQAQLIADRNYKVKEIEQRLALDLQGAQEAGEKALKSQKEIDTAKLRLTVAAQQQEAILYDNTSAEIQRHRLEAEKATNELILAERKQLNEETLQNTLAAIDREAQLRVAYLTAREAPTLELRKQQIAEVSQTQIEAIEAARDAQIRAAQRTYDEYAADHPGFTAGIAEEFHKFEQTRISVSRDADTQIQLNRYNAWKETDAAIAADQQEWFGRLQGVLGGIWDAFTTKSKSVWQALGDFLKSSILGTMKEIVTSRIAAAFTGMITGYPGPTFPGGVLGRPVYAPLGAPAPPQALQNQSTAILISSGNALTNSAAALTASAYALNSAAANLGASPSTVGEADRAIDEASAAVSSAGSSTAGLAGTIAGLPGGLPGIAPIPGIGNISIPGIGSVTGGIPHVTLPGMAPGMAGSTGVGTSAARSLNSQLDQLKSAFGIGGTTIAGVPWSQATIGQKLGTILTSKGVAGIAATVGTGLALSGLQRGGTAGNVQTVLGGAMAGYSVAGLFPDLALSPLQTALGGAGAGGLLAGLQRGGTTGLGMDVLGGAALGASIGSIFPGIGTAIGAAVGAVAGAVAGGIRLLIPGKDQQLRDALRQRYGIDVRDKNIRDQIMQIINTKYGGSISLGILSQDVMDIMRLYALSTGQSQAGLPRPMYPATFAQSQAGGLQLQPVYSGGQLVQNPYVGTTTTDIQNALTTRMSTGQNVFVTLDPQQASQLFAGQTISVLNNNPGAVANANTTAAVTGASRTTQASALLQPLSVMR